MDAWSADSARAAGDFDATAVVGWSFDGLPVHRRGSNCRSAAMVDTLRVSAEEDAQAAHCGGNHGCAAPAGQAASAAGAACGSRLDLGSRQAAWGRRHGQRRNLELRCRAHNLHEAEHFFRGRLPLLRERRANYEYSLSPTPIARSTFFLGSRVPAGTRGFGGAGVRTTRSYGATRDSSGLPDPSTASDQAPWRRRSARVSGYCHTAMPSASPAITP